MRRIDCTLPAALWERVQNQSRMTGHSFDHILSTALAEYFRIRHHALYQVSTSSALVEGVNQGVMRIGTLREHGDLGLGTFDHLDGEMAIVDGHVFQVRCDGSVREVDDDILSPFAAIIPFSPDVEAELENCPNFSSLAAELDRFRDSNNVFYALRVDGRFRSIHVRAVCRTEGGVRLAEAAASQLEFEFRNVRGTLVGFWTPEYAKTLNVPGYHLHFVSEDRTRGGHLLGCSCSGLRLRLQRAADLHIALPETNNFLNADLRADPSFDLAKAEGAQK